VNVEEMKTSDVTPGFLGAAAATVSSLCCLLPLAIILLGLGSGAFMMTTMRYRAVFIPAGIIGVSLGWVLYLRERRRCNSLGCRLVGGRLNLVVLLLASLIVVAAVTLDRFPDMTADLLMRATSGTAETMPAPGSATDHSTMQHEEEMR
jgi:hypothetical protein